MSDAEKIYTIEELKDKLTEKERVFCHQYIIDWNGARSARVAGYKEDSVYEIASQNLRKLHIKQYINLIKNNLEEESGITKLRQLNELAKIAYSNISMLHNDWIELTRWSEIVDNNPDLLAAVESIDTKTETKVYKTDGYDEQEVEIKYVKIKLYSKIQAMESINKMMGYNSPDKVDLTTKGKAITPISIVFKDFENFENGQA